MTPTSSSPAPRRACLAVPASSPRKLDKAAGIPVDELVIDLEDAVVPAAKDEAREAAVACLLDWREDASVAVRVNSPRTPWCHLDLAALAATDRPLCSVILPKVESAGDVEFAERLLAGAEAGRADRERPLGLQVLIETAAGLSRVEEIAAAGPGRLEAMILGYADLATSLGRSRERAADPTSWIAVQDRFLTAARANGLQAVDGPFLGVAPDGRFLAAARHARELGFDGKWAVHPAQVELLTEIFTPSPEEVERARSVLAAMARAEREGGAGAVAFDGEMLDEALAAGARQILARAGEATA